jgi:hypothetical protein
VIAGRKRARRLIQWGVGALLIVAVAFGVYAGILAKHVSDQLTAASQAATQFRAAVTSGDDKATQQALDQLRASSAAAEDDTSGFVWKALGHVPVYGDDARGVAVVSRVVDNLAHSPATDLVGKHSALDSLVPTNSRFDLKAIASLQKPVSQADTELAAAEQQLNAVDPSGFISKLRSKYVDLQQQVDEAAAGVKSADTALQVLPDMLGASGPRNYLLVVQNNAEIRATGGLPGSVSVMHTDDGTVKITKQVAGADLGQASKPVLPLTDAEKKLYFSQLGTYFLDANFTPDFPRAADLMRARWRQVEHSDISGVLMLDPVTLSYLLPVVGNITVDNVTLTPDNATDELLSKVYARYPNPAAQDAFFRDVAQQIFSRLVGGGFSAPDLLSGLTKSVSEHRVYVHDFDASVQGHLSGTTIAGDLPDQDSADPRMTVTLNDTTGSKMSYYLRYGVSAQATSCAAGAQTLESTMQLSSTAPKDAATALPTYVTGGGQFGVPPGQQIVTVRIYSPSGGSITGMTVNGKPNKPVLVTQGQRQVAMTYIQLGPGQNVSVAWKTQTGANETGPTEVWVTPSVEPGTKSSVVPTACG